MTDEEYKHYVNAMAATILRALTEQVEEKAKEKKSAHEFLTDVVKKMMQMIELSKQIFES